jgi:hypothetical protein
LARPESLAGGSPPARGFAIDKPVAPKHRLHGVPLAPSPRQPQLIGTTVHGSPYYPDLEAQSHTDPPPPGQNPPPAVPPGFFQGYFAAPPPPPVKPPAPPYSQDEPEGSEPSRQLTLPCPGFAVIGQCENTHTYAREIICNREWCSDEGCGGNHGKAHNRRIAHYLPKAQQLPLAGYMVLTIPPELRHKYKTQTALARLGTAARRMFQRQGFDRGLRRWHFFGDPPSDQLPTAQDNMNYHPHLNVLLPAGFLSESQLDAIRSAWGRILDAPKKRINIWYEYRTTPQEIVHTLNYILRPTFLFWQWNQPLAWELLGFRNTQTWGRWHEPEQWQLPESLDHEIPSPQVRSLEARRCPDCGKPITWTGGIQSGYLKSTWWVPLGSGLHKLVMNTFQPINPLT